MFDDLLLVSSLHHLIFLVWLVLVPIFPSVSSEEFSMSVDSLLLVSFWLCDKSTDLVIAHSANLLRRT